MTPTLYQSDAGVGGSSTRLLGRHVARRADHLARPAVPVGAGRELGRDAEVEDDDAPLVRDEDVRRLDVAVQLAGAWSAHAPRTSWRSAGRSCRSKSAGLRTTGSLASRIDRGFGPSSVCAAAGPGRRASRMVASARAGREAAAALRRATCLREIGPVDELHREERRRLTGHDELVELNEVRVAHVGERPELLLEPVERRRVEARQRLQRDGAAALAVDRLVDDAHPAVAERARDSVARRARPLGVCAGRKLAHGLSLEAGFEGVDGSARDDAFFAP